MTPCTHVRAPRAALWYRRPGEPCLTLALLCVPCRDAWDAQGVQLLHADGRPWIHPSGPPRAAPSPAAVDRPQDGEDPAAATSSAVVVEEVVKLVETTMVTKTCSVAGCSRPAKARGYCGSHYESEYRKPRAAKGAAPPSAAPARDHQDELAQARARIGDLEAILAEVLKALGGRFDGDPALCHSAPGARVKAIVERLDAAEGAVQCLHLAHDQWQARAVEAERQAAQLRDEVDVLHDRLEAWSLAEDTDSPALARHLAAIGRGRVAL